MQAMIISVFQRLQTIPTPPAPGKSATNNSALSTFIDDSQTPKTVEDLQLRMSAPDPTSAAIPAASTQLPQLGRKTSYFSTEGSAANIFSAPQSPAAIPQEEDAEPPQDSKPYGLPSLREILRVLISLLNPHDQQHTDSMRLMALGLLNVAFEIGGRSIGRFPLLRAMVADELCKYLFQVSKTIFIIVIDTCADLDNIAGPV